MNLSLFDKIFRPKKQPEKLNAYQTLTAWAPVFRQWDGNLYANEMVRAAVDARARHISKLAVSYKGSANKALQRQLRLGPNEWQTWSQWLYRTSVILDMQGSAFIVPLLDPFDRLTGFYTVLPSSCELVQSEDGTEYLRYRFSNGNTAAIERELCGVLTHFQYKDDEFGTANDALHQTMQLIEMQRQGVTEGIKNSATFRFMAKLSNFAKAEDIAKERLRFNKENLQGESGGILLFPNTYSDVKQMESKPFVQDGEQMAAINAALKMYFGVNDEILTNKATGDQLDAFFDGAIEPFAIQLSDVLNKMSLTLREAAYDNTWTVTANRLQYMSTANKISMAKEMGDRGIMLIDEIRELFNYAPLPDGQGQHAPIRGEYYMLDEGKAKEDETNAEQG